MSQQPGPTGEYFLMEEYILDPTLDFGTTNWLQPAQTWPMPMVNLEAHPWASSSDWPTGEIGVGQGAVIDNYDDAFVQWPPIAVTSAELHQHTGHQLSQSTGNWLADTALAQQGYATNFPGIANYGFHLHSGHQLSQSTGNWLPDTALAQQPVPAQQSSNAPAAESLLKQGHVTNFPGIANYGFDLHSGYQLPQGTGDWLAETALAQHPVPVQQGSNVPAAESLLKQGHVTNFPGIDYGFHLHSGHQLSQSTGNWLPDTALAHQQPVPVQQGSNPSVPENRLNCDKCAKTFTRPDSLKRHLNGSCTTNGNNGQSTGADCLLCEKDAKTFSRADHLLQHLRGYHKLSKGAVEHYKVRAGKRTATFEEEV